MSILEVDKDFYKQKFSLLNRNIPKQAHKILNLSLLNQTLRELYTMIGQKCVEVS